MQEVYYISYQYLPLFTSISGLGNFSPPTGKTCTAQTLNSGILAPRVEGVDVQQVRSGFGEVPGYKLTVTFAEHPRSKAEWGKVTVN